MNSQKAKPVRTNAILWAIALIAVLVIAATAFALSGRGETTLAGKLPAEVSVGQAVDMQAQGAFVLDVRTQAEWEEYHAPNSTHIPLDQLASRLSELPPDEEIVVVCRSGNRSAAARDLLLDAGFTQVTSMAGGLSTWRSKGYPTETGP